MMHAAVAKHLNEIRKTAERYGVARLEIFGSAMTPDFEPTRSDVDFIVHYPPDYVFGPFLKRYQEMEDELSSILGRPAQLVMTSALKRDRFRESVDLTRTTIYVASWDNTDAEGYSGALPVHH